MSVKIWNYENQTAEPLIGSQFESSSGIKIGTIIPFAGARIPLGYLLCDGAEISRAEYSKLFAVIGTAFGSGDGSTTFNVPDLRNKFVEGASSDNQLGSEIDAGIPNIKGNNQNGFNLVFHDGQKGEGAIYRTVSGGAYGSTGASANYGKGFGFDASKGEVHTVDGTETYRNDVYGKSDTVQPPAVCINYIIKANQINVDDTPDDFLDDSLTTTSNVWSAQKTKNEIDNSKGVYSTTETVVGTWINGKPLYRKVFDAHWNLGSTSFRIAHNIDNFDKIISISGTVANRFSIPRVTSDGAGNIDVAVYDGYMNFAVGGTIASNFNSGYVILEYTKTTD